MAVGDIEISQSQLAVILIAVEHGYKMCEQGHNLEKAKDEVLKYYTMKANPLGGIDANRR